MKLKITAIRDAGDIEKERVVLRAIADFNVGNYLILQTGFKGGSVTSRVQTAFWFPDKDVADGDFVVLYTKRGKSSEKDFKEVQSHFFYWGKSETIWDEKDRSAVLMYAPDWDSFQP